MENTNPTKDINAKSLLENKSVIAPILKATIEEFNDVTVEDIIEIYLKDPEDPNNYRIKALNTERGGYGEITNKMDLLFKVRTPKDYDLLVDIEMITGENNYILSIQLRTYMARLFTDQQYRLEELKKEAEEGKRVTSADLYKNLDHPVQIAIFTKPPKGRVDMITHVESQVSEVKYSDGLTGPIRLLETLKPLKSVEEAYSLERSIRIYVDLENKEGKTGLFKFLAEGPFNLTGSDEERLKVIEQYSGKIPKEEEMELVEHWGTSDYFKKIGRKEGKEIGRKEGKEIGRKEGKEIGRKEGIEIGRKEIEAKNKKKEMKQIESIAARLMSTENLNREKAIAEAKKLLNVPDKELE